MQGAVTEGGVVVHASGPATPRDLAYARRKVASVLPLAPDAVLFAKADLVVHADPARAQPVFAKAELDLDGFFVRAHATGSTAAEAVDASGGAAAGASRARGPPQGVQAPPTPR